LNLQIKASEVERVEKFKWEEQKSKSLNFTAPER
jgi:hypothetical protein